MTVENPREFPVSSQDDVVVVRQAVRQRAVQIGLSLVDQTKIVTAASEIARNAVVYGGGGTARLETLKDSARVGVRLTLEDRGPGIPDVDQAMTDGFTSGGGLGLGLGGAKRLSSEFELESQPGKGTRVTIIRWRT